MKITPRPYSMNNPEGTYFVSFSVVFWIDTFIRQRYKQIITDSLNFCIKTKGLNVHAWCLMSSHIHLIISAKVPERTNLSDILRDMKKFTSGQIIKSISEDPESRRDWLMDKIRFAASKNSRNTDHQFWQQDNHPEDLISNTFMDQKLDYIHNNPVLEGWVEEPSQYLYSSARDYCGIKGLVDVVLID